MRKITSLLTFRDCQWDIVKAGRRRISVLWQVVFSKEGTMASPFHQPSIPNDAMWFLGLPCKKPCTLLCSLGMLPLEFSCHAMRKLKGAAQVESPHVDVLVNSPSEDPTATAGQSSEEASRWFLLQPLSLPGGGLRHHGEETAVLSLPKSNPWSIESLIWSIIKRSLYTIKVWGLLHKEYVCSIILLAKVSNEEQKQNPCTSTYTKHLCIQKNSCIYIYINIYLSECFYCVKRHIKFTSLTCTVLWH